jgi:class 3 adenylate cyclase
MKEPTSLYSLMESSSPPSNDDDWSVSSDYSDGFIIGDSRVAENRSLREEVILREEEEEILRKLEEVMPPPPSFRLGDRSFSTTLRLKRQGFRESPGRLNNEFAVKAIRRDSQEWQSLLRPFIADLAFQSLVQRRLQGEVSFRPYTCHAAVLFIDLCDYSSIAALVSKKGAHTLSGIVNAYLGRLLSIVNVHGGDVIKFAGDAVLVVWQGQEEDLGINVLAAARCVMEMQMKAGHHPVEGTSLTFRIHCGLCCGLLESEVFAAPKHVHMQRLYHSVGGESLEEISELVGFAKAGQVCVSSRVAVYLGDRGSCRIVDCILDNFYGGEDCKILTALVDCKILTALVLEPILEKQLETHIMDSLLERRAVRRTKIEEQFIHPSVLRLLRHGGLSPTQISQMRNLCVLFIAMTSNGSSLNWLMEVQTILDRNRCPSKWIRL